MALKSLGAPIIGDERYHQRLQAQSCDRGYLHAWQLAFNFGGQAYRYESFPQVGKLFLRPKTQEALRLLQQKTKNG